MAPASNQLCSWDLIAAEVAAGRMMWSGVAQSGGAVPSFSQWQSKVANDGTNPSGYASNQIAPYSYLLARSVVAPTSVVAAVTNNCLSCNATSANSWSGRPSGWNTFFRENIDSGWSSFTNIGAVNSHANIGLITLFPGAGTYYFEVYFDNGITTSPTVQSNHAATASCPSCPA